MLPSVLHCERQGEAMNEDFKSLNNIDFLPQRYREAKIKRSASVWRLFCLFLFAGLLITASYLQSSHLQQARADLEKVNLLFTQANNIAKSVADMQAKNAPADQEAELLTYLRHPWPRSQVLAALISTVPESVNLESLEMRFQLPERTLAERVGAASDAFKPAQTGPGKDLKQLREQLDGGHWLVSLQGTAQDSADLHSYIAELEQQPLFSKVQLLSLEAQESPTSTACKFSAQIVLRQGYGQPSGPDPLKYAPLQVAAAESRTP
jgi:Tfp pilus assembly protein PilN